MNAPRSAIAPWAGEPSQSRLLELEHRHHENGGAAVADGVRTAQLAHHRRMAEGIV